jgi:hypothetical protein
MLAEVVVIPFREGPGQLRPRSPRLPTHVRNNHVHLDIRQAWTVEDPAVKSL